MKIKVRVNGVLEAEVELDEVLVSTVGISAWLDFQAQYRKFTLDFISECAKRAGEVNISSKYSV